MKTNIGIPLLSFSIVDISKWQTCLFLCFRARVCVNFEEGFDDSATNTELKTPGHYMLNLLHLSTCFFLVFTAFSAIQVPTMKRRISCTIVYVIGRVHKYSRGDVGWSGPSPDAINASVCLLQQPQNLAASEYRTAWIGTVSLSVLYICFTLTCIVGPFMYVDQIFLVMECGGGGDLGVTIHWRPRMCQSSPPLVGSFRVAHITKHNRAANKIFRTNTEQLRETGNQVEHFHRTYGVHGVRCGE